MNISASADVAKLTRRASIEHTRLRYGEVQYAAESKGQDADVARAAANDIMFMMKRKGWTVNISFGEPGEWRYVAFDDIGNTIKIAVKIETARILKWNGQ